jgi:hypothetical protein
MKKITATIILALLLLGGTQARAQRCTRLSFAPGRTSTVINGKVGASKHAYYCLHVRDGQRMAAHLTSPDRRARLYIGPDEYDSDFLAGADGVTDWEGELQDNSGAGNFTIVVEGPRAGAAFTLEVSVPPPARSSGATRAPAAPCGDFSGVYDTHYGPLRLTRTGEQVRGVYGIEQMGDSSVVGTVRGNVLTGSWREPQGSGKFRFVLDPDGRSFTGSFSPDGDPNAAGEWGGHCAEGGNK